MAVTTVKASAKGVRMAPRKIGLVASLVRGRTVADALTILEFTPKRAAVPVSKVIASAKANAEHNHNLKSETLQIVELNVSPGTRMKRYRPVSRGMAHPYQKRTTHISVVVAGEEKERAKAKTTTTTKEKK
jgi:large subunit ribosomal protein L22